MLNSRLVASSPIFEKTAGIWCLYVRVCKCVIKKNVTAKHLCATSPKNRIFEVPSEAEVKCLKRTFFNPKNLIDDLLKPIVVSGKSWEPRIKFIPKLNGLYWKAQLQVKWPHPMIFTGTHRCISQAEENAYLLACQLFQNIGLVYKVGNNIYPVTKEHVFSLLERMVDKNKVVVDQHGTYQLRSSQYSNTEGHSVWESVLTVPWPYHFSVTGTAHTIQASHHIACLLACIKLKYLNLLHSDNSLAEDLISKGAKQLLRKSFPSAEEFDPHYQIFVDASKIGFGAYLLTKTEDRVRWMSESWPEHFKADPERNGYRKFDSCFHESYALTAACYTWKHKFINKRVLCWSDNQHAVHLVNSAVYPDLLNRKIMKRFSKLSQILTDMCLTYDIKLQALHVKRTNNIAADHLSRVQVDRFREIVPGAEVKAKKTKKLLFLNPLVPSEYDPRNKKAS